MHEASQTTSFAPSDASRHENILVRCACDDVTVTQKHTFPSRNRKNNPINCFSECDTRNAHFQHFLAFAYSSGERPQLNVLLNSLFDLLFLYFRHSKAAHTQTHAPNGFSLKPISHFECDISHAINIYESESEMANARARARSLKTNTRRLYYDYW